jgi:hypothetical protein
MINRYKITAVHFQKIGETDFVNTAIRMVDSIFSTSIDYSKFIEENNTINTNHQNTNNQNTNNQNTNKLNKN